MGMEQPITKNPSQYIDSSINIDNTFNAAVE
jgi:hypothetical protein